MISSFCTANIQQFFFVLYRKCPKDKKDVEDADVREYYADPHPCILSDALKLISYFYIPQQD